MKISWKQGQPFLFFRSLGAERSGPCAAAEPHPDSGARTPLLLLSKPEPAEASPASRRQGGAGALF